MAYTPSDPKVKVIIEESERFPFYHLVKSTQDSIAPSYTCEIPAMDYFALVEIFQNFDHAQDYLKALVNPESATLEHHAPMCSDEEAAAVAEPPHVHDTEGADREPIPKKTERGYKKEMEWIRNNEHKYPGQWMAIYGDRLAAHHKDLKTVLSRTKEVLGDEKALIHRAWAEETEPID